MIAEMAILSHCQSPVSGSFFSVHETNAGQNPIHTSRKGPEDFGLFQDNDHRLAQGAGVTLSENGTARLGVKGSLLCTQTLAP
jgi:hypothetical protein